MPAFSERPAPGAARVLCDVDDASAGTAGQTAGVRWKLAEPGRQLDANVVGLPPGAVVDTHTEPELDVLVLVVAGEGELSSGDTTEPLAAGALCWLPRASSRRLAAGPQGLSYVTVHARRPGMRIGRGPAGRREA
ncbi:cupin domain-containing protein [Streptomyces hazeniae]|uniref:cupin domain-containing protein n=1 Tax=Streptomyces hazeniae TaxID=3075538 RepID=UPI00374E0F29